MSLRVDDMVEILYTDNQDFDLERFVGELAEELKPDGELLEIVDAKIRNESN